MELIVKIAYQSLPNSLLFFHRFMQHVFKYEQNEYKKEAIKWRDIDFMDNSECLQLFESKPTGLLCILDDLCK